CGRGAREESGGAQGGSFARAQECGKWQAVSDRRRSGASRTGLVRRSLGADAVAGLAESPRLMTRFGAGASLTTLLICCIAQMAAAGQETSPSSFTRPSVRAVRIDTTEAPVIDGDLSDEAWAKAAVIDNLRQRSPNPYEPATERTVVRILYDENNLYFSF